MLNLTGPVKYGPHLATAIGSTAENASTYLTRYEIEKYVKSYTRIYNGFNDPFIRRKYDEAIGRLAFCASIKKRIAYNR